MGIVGESLGQAEPTHHAERDVIDNASLAGLASYQGPPGVLDLGLGRLDQ